MRVMGRFVVAECVDIDNLRSVLFACLLCLPILLNPLLNELFHDAARVMCGGCPVLFAKSKDLVLLLRHVVSHELVVLWIVLHVEIVLAIAWVICKNCLRLRREMLCFFFDRDMVLLLL